MRFEGELSFVLGVHVHTCVLLIPTRRGWLAVCVCNDNKLVSGRTRTAMVVPHVHLCSLIEAEENIAQDATS